MCGYCPTAQELVIASTDDDNDDGVTAAAAAEKRRESDALCVAIDVKLNSTLRSLQIDCSRCKRGLVAAVLRELVTNKRVLRLKLYNLTRASLLDGSDDSSRIDDVTAAVFEQLLTQNKTLRTLQLHFLPHDDDDDDRRRGGEGGEPMEQRILLAVLSGLQRNEGLTTLQLDNWVRDSAVLLALGSALKTAASLHRLGLFASSSSSSSSSWSKEDISTIASCLQHNTTLRVLSLSMGPQKRGIISSSSSSISIDGATEGEKKKEGQLTPDMQGLFASATRDRTLPLVVRTAGGQDGDRVFGAIHGLSVSTARLWEPEDEVELLDDDHTAGSGDGSGDDRWVVCAVISVSSDHRYCVRTPSGAMMHCSSKTLRPSRRDGRHPSSSSSSDQRRFYIHPPPPPPSIVTAALLPLPCSSAPSTFHATTTDGDIVSTDAIASPYSKGEKVELRYYGGVKWHPATILDILAVPVPYADDADADAAVTASPSSTVSNNTAMALVTLSAGADHLEPALLPSSSSSSCLEVLEVESCFIRPLVMNRGGGGVIGGLIGGGGGGGGMSRMESSEDAPTDMPYDAGCYRRGDYVEVKGMMMTTMMTAAEGGGGVIAEWRRGRVATDRKNGLYDVRMENGRDAVGVEASRLRHHFRSRDPAEIRLQGSFDWRPVVIKRQDKDGSYCVLFDDDDATIESGTHLIIASQPLHAIISHPMPSHDM